VADLDDLQGWSTLDPQGMRTLVAELPAHARRGLEIARTASVAPMPEVSGIVVAGLGGSAIGADVVRSGFADRLRVPLTVHRDYGLPRHVGPDTLVVAASHSGNTEETLAAYADARRRGAPVVCLTSGGRLADAAVAEKVTVVRIPGGLPPRAALGYASFALLGVLRAAGFLDAIEADVEETVGLLDELARRYDGGQPERENPAKRLARALAGRVVVVYGSAARTEAAALRWRGQLEENAKTLAFHHLLPEMNHNELVGWREPEGVLRQLGVVLLRDRGDHPQVQRRFELTRALLAERAGVVEEVWSEGASTLARIYSLVYLADFVSLYVARACGVDPTPVEAIESLKTALGSRGEESH
jgi:glucose/mannose-6-phosphate isomerase